MQRHHASFRRFHAGPDDVGRRLDRVARRLLADLSLGRIFGAIRRGDIRVNRGRKSGDYRIQSDDVIAVRSRLFFSESDGPEVAASSAECALEHNGPLPMWFPEEIVLETDSILAMNKPQGMLVHGRDSLEELVRRYLLPSQRESLSFVPGPLHRLDRNTSGIVLFGKNLAGARRFTGLLRARLVHKDYLAILQGKLHQTETWSDRLSRDSRKHVTFRSDSGREALCVVSPLAANDSATLARIAMESGFTHQIRAQAALHDHPLLGDVKYGADRRTGGYQLHAHVVRLASYDSVLGFHVVRAPLPQAFGRQLRSLFGDPNIP